MKYISFLGASGTVTGSSYFLRADSGKGIVIDMGMFQGSHEIETFNYESIPLSPTEIDAVFLTHAHLDHCGRLPLLRRLGYHGPIYMTEPTRALAQLTLYDAVHVAREHRYNAMLYNEQDVAWILNRAVIVPYNQAVQTAKFAVTFRDAGHILGSAFLEVFCTKSNDSVSRIVFSGDIGNFPEDLLQPTAFASSADVVVMESTYGDRAHSHESPADALAEEIQAIEADRSTLLIPAFSVERSQEILHLIDHLKKDQKIRAETRVFLDSPLSVHVTRVYQHYRSLYSQELKDHALVDDPFEFPGLTMVESPRDSRELSLMPGPKVIIAGSGMMNGGRILRHAKEMLPLDSTRLLFVGFQGEGSLGRHILDGATSVVIDNITIPVRAHVRKCSGMSSHADQPKLLQWLSKIRGVSDVCLTHGEDGPRKVLGEKIVEVPTPPTVHIPYKGHTVTFGEQKNAYVMTGSSSNKMRYNTFHAATP